MNDPSRLAFVARADSLTASEPDGEERQRLFDRIMATTPDLVYLYDLLEDRNVYANQALSSVLGYTPEQIQALGAAFLPSVLDPGEREQRAQTQAQIAALPDGAVYTHIYRALHADGTWRWLQDRTLAFERTPDGRIKLVLGIVQDITEQRSLEAALRERSADLTTFLETMPIAVLVSEDPSAATITGNAAAAQLLRAPLGSNLSLTAPAEELAAIHSLRRDGRELAPHELPIQHSAAHGEPVHDPDLELLFDDGTVKHIAGHVSPLLTEGGAVRGAVAAYVDTTENWRAQQMERLYARLSADLVEVASYEDLLVRVTRLPVPDLADFCMLDLLGPDGQAARVAGAHADPQLQALVDTLLRYPPQARPGGVVEVLRGGAPLLISELADEVLVDLAQDERHLAALRALTPRSVMVVPLAARGATIGALTLTLAAPVRRYNARDLAMAQEVGVRIALALENAQLHSVTQQHAVRMQVLAEVSRRFAEAHPSLPVVLEQVSDELAGRIGNCCIIRLLSADRAWLEPVAVAHPDEEARAFLREMAAREPYHVGDGLTGRVAQQGLSVLLPTPDLETLRRVIKPQYAAFMERYGVASLMIAPLRVRGEVIGTIMMLRDTAQRPYSGDDQLLLEDIADRAALAINHARLYDTEQQARAAAERSAQRLALLQTVAAQLSTALAIDQVGAVTIHQGVVALGADAGSVVLLEPDGVTLRMAAACGYSHQLLDQWRSFPSSLATPIGDAVRSGEPVWIENRDDYMACYPLLASSESVQRDSAWAAVPLIAGARVLGALGLSFTRPTPFSADDRTFTISLAQQCAQAFERAQLFEAERQSRAEAEAAVQVREQFLSVAAHELKTPLTPLIGQAQLLLRRLVVGAPVEERFRQSAEVIVNQARRLSRLVAGLLDLNRLQTGHLELVRAPVDLGLLVRRIADEMQPSLAQHTLLVETSAEPLVVSADALRLEQVLHNLLQNAAKYSPHGGQIWLRATRDDTHALLAVQDQGIGIPPEAIPRLFLPFYRAENAKDSSVMGMGIGLAVVKELVELHGGSVRVESAEGVGSTFSVRLPLAAPR